MQNERRIIMRREALFGAGKRPIGALSR